MINLNKAKNSIFAKVEKAMAGCELEVVEAVVDAVAREFDILEAEAPSLISRQEVEKVMTDWRIGQLEWFGASQNKPTRVGIEGYTKGFDDAVVKLLVLLKERGVITYK